MYTYMIVLCTSSYHTQNIHLYKFSEFRMSTRLFYYVRARISHLRRPRTRAWTAVGKDTTKQDSGLDTWHLVLNKALITEQNQMHVQAINIHSMGYYSQHRAQANSQLRAQAISQPSTGHFTTSSTGLFTTSSTGQFTTSKSRERMYKSQQQEIRN